MTRLEQGGRIDRNRPLNFRFDGRALTGYAGDSLASALLANDVRLVGRSFKYHRPRGIFGAGAEEPNALVRLGEGRSAEPNQRATLIELYEGLEAAPQNCWPSLGFDLRAVQDRAHALLPAGFYYKTFMWPRWSWFEPAIRRAAGLGVAPPGPDPQHYTRRHAFCEVLIIGAGPSGLAAAEAAAATGRRVILVDDQAEPGGSLLWRGGAADRAGLGDRLAVLRSRPNLRLLTRTAAAGLYDHNWMLLHQRLTDHLGPAAPAGAPRQRLWQVRAERIILATGALERPLVFPDNDRPGIMLADAVQHYLQRYAVLPGRHLVLFANNDAAYALLSAVATAGQGVVLEAVVDSRAEPGPEARAIAAACGVPLHAGSAILATGGRHRLRQVTLGGLDGGARRTLACDLLAISGGWTPNVHLYSQTGAKLRFDETQSCFRPAETRPGLSVIGGANGVFDSAAARDEAHAAAAGASPPASIARPLAVSPLWRVPGGGRQWVDFQNDVTADDIALAARESFVSVEHMKRYTTAGMATDQGKTSNVNALALLGEATGRPVAMVGTTTFRPPVQPLTLGAIAGRDIGALYRARRRLPADDRHVAAGARFGDYAGWQRPDSYPGPGETSGAATAREVAAVRATVGLFDASTLGKIEIAGPDAERLLEHIFTTRVEGLGVDRLRYGVMATEHGVLFDDAVVMRLGPERYWLGASTSHAAAVAAGIEEWLQCEWVDWRVTVTDATAAWATLAVAGPSARALLRAAGTDLDLDSAAFPYLALRHGRVAGLPVIAARVSFSGEQQYELHLPAGQAVNLWDRLTAAGAAFGCQPVGMDAWLQLRLEKGFPIAGIDSDGTTIPDDWGFNQWHRKAVNFVGRRSLMRPEAVRPDRPVLVGLEALEPTALLPVGAVILPGIDAVPPCAAAGRVTSSMLSAVLGRSIALALLTRGRDRVGETLTLWFNGRRLAARVVALPFYDPDGGRMRG